MTQSARERMLAGVPATERRVELAGASTTLLEGGEGPPLVLLHGGIECGGAYWAPVIERLAESHRVVVPDVPGLGESAPVADLTPEVFAEWFRALLDAACEGPPVLIAHSLLGTLAARFAAREDSFLERLVIYAAPGIGPYRTPIGLIVRAVMFDLRPSERNAERFDRFAFFDFDEARRRDDGWLEAWSVYSRARARVPHVKRTMRRLIKSCTKQVPDAELRRIEIPTTLIWGSHDRFVSLPFAEEAGTRLGWPLQVIDESGHVPHIERTEAFLDGLRALLRDTRTPSSSRPEGSHRS